MVKRSPRVGSYITPQSKSPGPSPPSTASTYSGTIESLSARLGFTHSAMWAGGVRAISSYNHSQRRPSTLGSLNRFKMLWDGRAPLFPVCHPGRIHPRIQAAFGPSLCLCPYGGWPDKLNRVPLRWERGAWFRPSLEVSIFHIESTWGL